MRAHGSLVAPFVNTTQLLTGTACVSPACLHQTQRVICSRFALITGATSALPVVCPSPAEHFDDLFCIVCNSDSINRFRYDTLSEKCRDDIVVRVGVSTVLAKSFGIGYQSPRHY